MDTTPPRTAPTADALPVSTPPAGPVEIPAEFRSQRLRHKEYKRRGPVSGSRFDEEEIGETRTALSSRFFDAADDAGASAPSAPPPPPPPPPPPSPAVPKRAGLSRRREIGEGRGEPVPAAAAAAVTARTAEAGEVETARATEAGAGTVGALRGAAIGARTGADSTGDAATDNATEDREGDGKPCAGGKRKVGPAGREEDKTESPRKAADNGGRCGDVAVGNGERSVGEARERAEEEEGVGVEPHSRVPPKDAEGEAAGVRDGGDEDCGLVGGSPDNGGADNNDLN